MRWLQKNEKSGDGEEATTPRTVKRGNQSLKTIQHTAGEMYTQLTLKVSTGFLVCKVPT